MTSMGEKRTCPYCGNEHCTAEYVDNGVGMQQCTPFGCEQCGAVEIGPYDKQEGTPEEQKVGWYKGSKRR